MFRTQTVYRRRLAGLMTGRLVVVTVMLGAMLLVSIHSGSALNEFTPRFLLALISGMYAASLGFSLWMWRHEASFRLAAFQLIWDVLVISGLVYVSGAAASICTFLYGIAILMAAITLGPRAAYFFSGLSIVLYGAVGFSVSTGAFPYPPDQEFAQYMLPVEDLSFSLLTNIVGLALVGILASHLSERLTQAGGELRRAEASAASLARLNDDIVRCLSSGLITANLEGKVLTVNAAAADMFRAHDLVGQPLSNLLSIDLSRSHLEVPSHIGRHEGEANRPDGTAFPVGYTQTPLSDVDGRVIGTLINFQDLTELMELRHAAERAEQLAALGRLAAGLAHEIRNPLSSILGSVELVKESKTLNAEERKLLGVVLSEVERLDHLVTTMLDLGKPREPSLARVSLTSIADDVITVAGTSAGAVTIEREFDFEPVFARADADQMRQVLWNLIRNAVQASSARSKIIVSVKTANDQAVIEVKDEGPGIDEDALPYLFDIFYSGRPHGVGLGLALVKQIVEAHQGKVTAENRSPRGALFRVVIGAQPLDQDSIPTSRHSTLPLQ